MSGRSDARRWPKRRLGEVCEIIAGQSPPGETYRKSQEGLPFFQGKADFGHTSPIATTWCVEPVKIAQPGDILISVRAPVGPTNIADTECCIGRGLAAIRCNEVIDRDFLLAYLKLVEPHLCRLGSGSTFSSINRAHLENLNVPVASIDLQRRVAAELREKFERIDQARVAAAAQLEAARALPAAYLREVFDSPEAQKWPTKALAETAELLPSKSIATAGDTEVRAITTACLTEQGFDAGGIKLARMWSADAAESIVRTGEVLIARSNTSELVGRAATYNGELSGVVASDLTVRIMPQQDVLSSEFLGRYLSYLYLTGFWKERAGGASGSMKKITRTQILRLKVPVPTTEDQGRICARLGSQLNGFKSLAAAIAGEGQAIATMQNAILRKVFNGEV
jgi:type I restriction enzyme S subunit